MFQQLAQDYLPSPGVPEPDYLALPEFVSGLKTRGLATEIRGVIETLRLPVSAETGFELSIDGDPFLVYRFEDQHSADAFSEWHRHSIEVGRFGFRSDPPVQYEHMGPKSIDMPLDEIEWSSLLWEEDFIRCLQLILSGKSE